MPGNNKKTPITNTRKRVTASAGSTATIRVRKEAVPDKSGSYLQEPAVSTVTLNQLASSTSDSSNEQIIALLLKLDKSMDKMVQRPSLNSTPVVPQSHNLENQTLNNHLGHSHQSALPTQAVKYQDRNLNGDSHPGITQWAITLNLPRTIQQPLTFATQLTKQAGKMLYYLV